MFFYIAVAIAAFLLYFNKIYLLDKLFYRLPPGPRPLPFIGTLWIFRQLKKKGLTKFIQTLSEPHKTYGDIYRIYYGGVRAVVLGNADLIQEAVVEKDKFFSARPAEVVPTGQFITVGLISASGDVWRTRRRFAMRAMRDFGMGKQEAVNHIHDEVGFFVGQIERNAEAPFVPHELINNAVSNVICSIVFGKRFDYDDPYFKSILRKTAVIFRSPPGKETGIYIFPPLRYFLVPDIFKRIAELNVHLKEVLTQTIADHRKTFNKDHMRDFADLFIENEMIRGEAITLDELSKVTLDLFLAGTETTSTALNWTLVWLCKYPDIQMKCQKLVDDVLGTSDRLPTLENRPDLAYIDAVFYEVLRHPSIAPQGLIHANATGVMSIGGYDIPQNTLVLTNIWRVHHNEGYWKEPMKFNPDRWIDDKGKLINHGKHFIPFGSGPRVCLGESLARVEYFIFLVSLLQRFTFSFAPGEDVDINGGASGITYVPPEYKLIATRRY